MKRRPVSAAVRYAAFLANLRRAEQAALATIVRDTRAPDAVAKADADRAQQVAEGARDA